MAKKVLKSVASQPSRRAFGWVPDMPDHRDVLYAAPAALLPKLLTAIDLRDRCPAVYDQGQLGSCTANAIAGAHQFEQMKQGLPAFAPSRLFIYYNERSMEHTIDSDAGAQLRDGMKSVGKIGACPETDWPYDITQFRTRPTATAYTDAEQNKAVQYRRVSRSLAQMRACLAEGFPFVFGITVYESFESDAVATSGQVPMPSPSESCLGGHALVAVGYNDQDHVFIARNSWGDGWGMKGYFTIPYAYLLDENLADDFWTIRLVA